MTAPMNPEPDRDCGCLAEIRKKTIAEIVTRLRAMAEFESVGRSALRAAAAKLEADLFDTIPHGDDSR